MPRYPTSEELDDHEDVSDTRPPQPAYFAEQALLGALLLEPQRLADVTGIDGSSFSEYAHGVLFAAIRNRPAPDPVQHTLDTSWLNAVLTAAREHARGLTASYLHTLIQVCPWPRHASTYARMIETDHARRTLRAHAMRLVQTARDDTLPHPVPATLAAADALADAVDEIAARFPPPSGPLQRIPASVPIGAPHNTGEADDEEWLLLATATAHPADVEQMRWLAADDFSQPLQAGLWQSLTALAYRRAPVDPITVLWEAQQRGLLKPDVEPTKLLNLLASPAGSPQHWGELIVQRSLLTTAQQVGSHLQALTDDPTTTPYQFIIGGRRALARLSSVRTRWHQATSQAPTINRPRDRTTSPPRASPPRTTAPPATRISR
ncbi:replicative DNA helicase [Streptomyces sp. 15-116A]|uniref:DnaB-like helicase N-terminal domain-containing protein n=1 Tax=Streptomyces sp. 15-116A TaxID=2259035 RepID=UPI0021B3698A|nr:DnaB-like helicase N-terminal domain-containing protein [Streptomyces sp. 15-116A]MCT7351625.1 replicative DNA helicase [Streptomyces sp. 15-116A]